MAWVVETLNRTVDKEIEGLPADMRARFRYISDLISEFGLEEVREPHVKHIRGPLWEMRVKGKAGIFARALRHGYRAARRSGSRFRQENASDPQPRDRARPQTG
jgi:hypothetical protein